MAMLRSHGLKDVTAAIASPSAQPVVGRRKGPWLVPGDLVMLPTRVSVEVLNEKSIQTNLCKILLIKFQGKNYNRQSNNSMISILFKICMCLPRPINLTLGIHTVKRQQWLALYAITHNWNVPHFYSSVCVSIYVYMFCEGGMYTNVYMCVEVRDQH